MAAGKHWENPEDLRKPHKASVGPRKPQEAQRRPRRLQEAPGFMCQEAPGRPRPKKDPRGAETHKTVPPRTSGKRQEPKGEPERPQEN